MDKRDIARIRNFPAVCVPFFSQLEKPDSCGERVLVASNGTFLEVTRKWGQFIRQIGEYAVQTPLPYGELSNHTQLAMQKLPKHLLEEFNELARQNSHVEIGASIVWNENTKEFRLLPSESLKAGPGHLQYKLADLSDGDHVVIDCHSHSKFPAFFSNEDDRDDLHAVKFAYVVGSCDLPVQTAQLRLCIKGMFEHIPMQLSSTITN